MKTHRTVHPDRLDEACERMRCACQAHLDGDMPAALVESCLAVPAHKLLRVICGGYLSVAWWAFRRALASLQPQWLWLWRLGRVGAKLEREEREAARAEP